MIYDIGNIGNKVYDCVDLGLPSKTLWSTMNVGASKPSDFGLYFQWGDTVGYTKNQIGKDKQFTWADYKWNPSGDGETFTKYAIKGITLELKDDAANVYMRGDWHIPTPEQIRELLDNTISTWVTQDGVEGIKFTSKSGKSLFIPAAGYALGGKVNNSGEYGYVWSSMLDPFYVRYVKYLYFSLNYNNLGNGSYRCNGYPVRGVIG